MEKEKIIRIWRFAYAKVFGMEGAPWNLKDKKREWETKKIFWRFYWLTSK